MFCEKKMKKEKKRYMLEKMIFSSYRYFFFPFCFEKFYFVL